MEYMLLITNDPDAEPYDPQFDNIGEWVDDLEKRGIRGHGDRLRPPQDAKIVRIRRGRLEVTDGPFTETKEWIAGYDVLDCDSMDQAVEIASRHPMARFGRIEVRAIWPFE